MLKNDKGFVLSSNKFSSIKDAEAKATGWFNGGHAEQKMRLFKVVEEYRPVIKFIKVGGK